MKQKLKDNEDVQNDHHILVLIFLKAGKQKSHEKQDCCYVCL